MSVLIFRVGNLGDTVVALPAFYSISFKHNNKKIYLLTNDTNSAVSFLDKIGIFSQTLYLSKGFKFILDIFKLYFHIKKNNIETIYNLATRFNIKSSIRDEFFFKFICGIKNYYAVPSISYESKNKIKYDYEGKRLLNVIGYTFDSTSYISKVLCNDSNIKISGKYIIICPFSNMQSKNWGEDNFIIIINHVLSKYNDINVVLIGVNSEFNLDSFFIDSNRVMNLIGKTNISDLLSIINNCLLMISLDTGPIHIAALLKKYSINIFSSRDHEGLWEPPFADNIRINVECSLCMKDYCEKNFCIKDIKPSFVINKVDNYLSTLH
jgi:ADP-heptose:LPS heptosyltransferase